MKKSILLSISCFCFGALFAQKAATIKQLNGKTVSTKVIEQRLTRIVDSAHIAGLQVAIINDNQIVWANSFGLKNTEKQTRLNDSTIMYAASFTKSVSAYLFLRLVDKGIFSLDKPVYQYLKNPVSSYPKWKDLGDDTVSFNKITARMLLSHTSGMPVMRAVYHDKVNLIAKPGERFYYSNEGMNFLGFVIEEYTGKKLDDLADEEIFKPLHMTHTSMIWDPAFEKNFSTAYFKDGRVYGSERRTESRAAGSMSTTATDYAKFVIALQTQYGLSKPLFTQMFTAQININSKKGFGPERDSLTNENKKIGLAWGLGAGLVKTPYGKAFFHTGHGDANQNYYIAYPAKGTAIVMLSNSENFEQAAQHILQATLGNTGSPLKWLGYLDN
ncbi:MAG TPA: serine hydrolase domain-containing protein [Mucilaginibacter sp.]